MNRTELEELIRIGENSGVEFKRDDVVPERLAKELAALLNQEGGHLLLGVEDDGTVSGLTRAPKQVEERIMEIARMHLRPAAIPFWENLKLDDGNVVGVISLPADAPDKPYKAKRGTAWVTQVRVGTIMVDAHRDISGAASRLPELDAVLIARRKVAGRRHFNLAHLLHEGGNAPAEVQAVNP